MKCVQILIFWTTRRRDEQSLALLVGIVKFIVIFYLLFFFLLTECPNGFLKLKVVLWIQLRGLRNLFPSTFSPDLRIYIQWLLILGLSLFLHSWNYHRKVAWCHTFIKIMKYCLRFPEKLITSKKFFLITLDFSGKIIHSME